MPHPCLPRRDPGLGHAARRVSWLLGVVGVAFWLAWGFVHVEAAWWDLEARRQLDHTESERAEAVAAAPAPVDPWGEIAAGDLVGRVAIPRVGVEAPVYHGVDEALLRRAVGHVPGTALPGQGDNVGLAGHRDTFFRGLRDIRESDVILVDTPHGERRYAVVETRVVEPEQVEVLAPTGTESLTLVTCYPFRWVGPAPRRFIVRATAIADDAIAGDA